MNTIIPSWMSQRLAEIVHKAKEKNSQRSITDIIDELSFQAITKLQMDLKVVPEELRARLPSEFLGIIENFNQTVLSPLETACIIILEDGSNASLPAAIDSISRLKAEGLSEYEATKAAGIDFAVLRIETLIDLLSGGSDE